MSCFADLLHALCTQLRLGSYSGYFCLVLTSMGSSQIGLLSLRDTFMIPHEQYGEKFSFFSFLLCFFFFYLSLCPPRCPLG